MIKRNLIFIFGMLFFISGCTVINESTSSPESQIVVEEMLQTDTPTPEINETPTFENTIEASATLSPTLKTSPSPTSTKILLDYDNMPPGDFLFIQKRGSSFRWAISVENYEEYIFSEKYGSYSPFGPNYFKYNTESPKLYDYTRYDLISLENYEIFSFKVTDLCSSPFSNPTLEYIAFHCTDEENFSEGIKVLRVSDGEMLKVSKFDDPEAYYWGVYWSPDGKYINYFEVQGMYITEASCLEEPETCPEKTKGPFFSGKVCTSCYFVNHHVWSPDSQKVASLAGDFMSVYLFDVNTEETTQLFTNENGVCAITWSLDGRGIYYTVGKFLCSEYSEIRYYDIETGKDVLFYDEGVVIDMIRIE